MYEIIIKRKQTITKPVSQSYEIIGKEEDGSNKYGYVTKPSYEVDEWVEVFKQQNPECNILDVVAAFNGVTFK